MTRVTSPLSVPEDSVLLFPNLSPPEQLARDISVTALRYYNAGVPFFVGRCTCTRAAEASTIFYGGAPTSVCPSCGQQFLLELILPPKGTPGDLWTHCASSFATKSASHTANGTRSGQSVS